MRRISGILGLIIIGLFLIFGVFYQKNKSTHIRRPINTTVNLKSDLLNRSPDLVEKLNILSSYISNIYHYPSLPSLRFVFFDENETSDIFRDIYLDFDQRKIMMATVEDFYPVIKNLNLDPKNTIFVNKKMLQIFMGNQFDPKNPTENQILVGKIIVHETEHLKQQMILDNSGSDITLDNLFWQNNRPTPIQRLLEALADARLNLNTTKSYRGEEILKTINLEEKNIVYNRLSQIYVLYKDLMEKLDKNSSIEKSKAQNLIQLIKNLNSSPTTEEKKLLQLN